MIIYDVKSVNDALAYLTDCTLATVADMAPKKRKGKNAYQRQINIAQKCCDLMERFDVSPEGTRAEDIIRFKTVKEWAKQYETNQADANS